MGASLVPQLRQLSIYYENERRFDVFGSKVELNLGQSFDEPNIQFSIKP